MIRRAASTPTSMPAVADLHLRFTWRNEEALLRRAAVSAYLRAPTPSRTHSGGMCCGSSAAPVYRTSRNPQKILGWTSGILLALPLSLPLRLSLSFSLSLGLSLSLSPCLPLPLSLSLSLSLSRLKAQPGQTNLVHCSICACHPCAGGEPARDGETQTQTQTQTQCHKQKRNNNRNTLIYTHAYIYVYVYVYIIIT